MRRNQIAQSPRYVRASAIVIAVVGVLGALPAGATPAVRTQLVLWRYSDATAFQEPRGIAFDPLDGALYVGNAGQHRIEVFSKTGRALTQFVHRVVQPDGAAIDGTPCALAFDRSGRLLVADLKASYVDVLDRRGHWILRLPIEAGQPNAIAVGADGAIYVGTSGEVSKIYRFRPDYTPDGSWGEPGTGKGQLFGVSALGVLKDGSLAVACTRTDVVVQIFSPKGEFLRGFGTHEVGDGNFSFPSGLAVTRDGLIWVVDEIRQTLQVFDDQGNLVTKSGQRGAGPGEFAQPSSLTYDGASLIALTDREIGRVQVLGVTEE